MYLVGLDIGSSSVKASLINAETGNNLASDFFPKEEMEIIALQPGWAEQHPQLWWQNLCLAVKSVIQQSGVSGEDIKGIGISYQMHGLVLIDKDKEVLRPAIIWCDSRAVPYGEKAFEGLGEEYCLTHLLNSPGNFTAAKLAWVKENESEIYKRIYKILLPGDYIALKLTGEPVTTLSGLSEGIFWDFPENKISEKLLNFYGIDSDICANIVPTFGIQGLVTKEAANQLGLKEGTPVAYRAGDQPNNALSLNVLQPGEIASTCGTSGVVYGINDQLNYDPLSRINIFAHVNHRADNPRVGVMHCVNGAGILNAWVKKNFLTPDFSYNDINVMAESVSPGAEGLTILPFGNGAERILCNRDITSSFHGINFNIHRKEHVFRAVQEGIAFSFKYGMEVMQKMGMSINVIKAGYANLFLSPLFREILSTVSDCTIELYNTDGSIGAARGAGIGADIYKDTNSAFQSLKVIDTIYPNNEKREAYQQAYHSWRTILEKI